MAAELVECLPRGLMKFLLFPVSVDALFGFSFQPPIRPNFLSLIEALAQAGFFGHGSITVAECYYFGRDLNPVTKNWIFLNM